MHWITNLTIAYYQGKLLHITEASLLNHSLISVPLMCDYVEEENFALWYVIKFCSRVATGKEMFRKETVIIDRWIYPFQAIISRNYVGKGKKCVRIT